MFIFFGNMHTPEGAKLNPKKVDAIKQMQPPFTKQQLSSFLYGDLFISLYYKSSD